jgi:hypothetical protein
MKKERIHDFSTPFLLYPMRILVNNACFFSYENGCYYLQLTFTIKTAILKQKKCVH